MAVLRAGCSTIEYYGMSVDAEAIDFMIEQNTILVATRTILQVDCSTGPLDPRPVGGYPTRGSGPGYFIGPVGRVLLVNRSYGYPRVLKLFLYILTCFYVFLYSFTRFKIL